MSISKVNQHLRTRFLANSPIDTYEKTLQALLRRCDMNAFKRMNGIPLEPWESHCTGELLEWLDKVQEKNRELACAKGHSSA